MAYSYWHYSSCTTTPTIMHPITTLSQPHSHPPSLLHVAPQILPCMCIRWGYVVVWAGLVNGKWHKCYMYFPWACNVVSTSNHSIWFPQQQHRLCLSHLSPETHLPITLACLRMGYVDPALGIHESNYRRDTEVLHVFLYALHISNHICEGGILLIWHPHSKTEYIVLYQKYVAT